MSRIIKVLIWGLLFSFIFAEVLKIPLITSQIKVSLLDFFAGSLTISCLWNLKKYLHLLKSQKIIREFMIFIAICIISLILTPLQLDSAPRLTAFLYILRFFSYFHIYLSLQFLEDKSHQLISRNIFPGLILAGIILALFGWVQYFLYPDLRNLYYLGWDPHYKRIYSTIFDPNFLGLFLALTFMLVLNGKFNKLIKFSSLAFVFITLLFTYSRSSYLSLFTGLFLYSFQKKKLALFIIFILFACGLAFALPRPAGEGVRLERILSIEKRVENWQFGLFLTVKNPLLGVGFNTIRYAKEAYHYFEENIQDSHSGAGLDNSLIFVAATTGLVGLYQFGKLIIEIIKRSDRFTKILLAVIFVHSLFLNSLFYPQVLVWLWLLVGISYKNEKITGKL